MIPARPDGLAIERDRLPTGSPPTRRFASQRSVSLLLKVASVIGGIALWQLISTLFFAPILFPPPTRVFPELAEKLADGSLFEQSAVSLARIGAGFGFGSLIGAVAGLLISRIRIVQVLTEPWVQFLRFIPVIALLAPFIVWFGIGETSKVALIIYTTTFIVMLNTIAGVARISPQKFRAAQCLGASQAQILVTVVIPGSLAFILTGMRLAMANSFMTVVSAELVAANSGIGYMINQARLFLDTPTIFVGIITLSVLGFVADFVLMAVQRKWLARYVYTA